MNQPGEGLREEVFHTDTQQEPARGPHRAPDNDHQDFPPGVAGPYAVNGPCRQRSAHDGEDPREPRPELHVPLGPHRLLPTLVLYLGRAVDAAATHIQSRCYQTCLGEDEERSSHFGFAEAGFLSDQLNVVLLALPLVEPTESAECLALRPRQMHHLGLRRTAEGNACRTNRGDNIRENETVRTEPFEGIKTDGTPAKKRARGKRGGWARWLP